MTEVNVSFAAKGTGRFMLNCPHGRLESDKFDCPNCGHKGLMAEYCERCGTKVIDPVVPRCPKCTRIIIGEPAFCPQCGERLDAQENASVPQG
jgi:predicted RNA-binding Zn-ribbon protein involved in translation (DUF1610 family)